MRGEYTIETIIQNKMRLDKCNTYTVKETLGYRRRKKYAVAARGTAKREEKQWRTNRETNSQTNHQSSQ